MSNDDQYELLVWPGPNKLAGVDNPRAYRPAQVFLQGDIAAGEVKIDIVFFPKSQEHTDDSFFFQVWVFPTGQGPGSKPGLRFDYQPKNGKPPVKYGNGKVDPLVFDVKDFGLKAKSGDKFDILIAYHPSADAPATDHEIVVGGIVVQ